MGVCLHVETCLHEWDLGLGNVWEPMGMSPPKISSGFDTYLNRTPRCI